MVQTRRATAKEQAAHAAAAPAPVVPTVPTVPAAPTAAAGPTASETSSTPGAGRNKKRSAPALADESASKRQKTIDPTQDESAGQEAPDAGAAEEAAAAAAAIEAPDESPDAKFLREAIDEISKLKLKKKKTNHTADLRIVKPLLRSMKQPLSEAVHSSADFDNLDGDKAPAAYVLTADVARSLLAGDRVVDAPVFVAGGAKKLFDSEASRRPFEEVLSDWFPDSEETYTVNDPEGLGNGDHSIQWMRDHFLANNGYVEHPWNFADILNPMNLMATPEFLESTNCRLLRDIDRAVLFAITSADICLEDCSNEKIAVDLCCEKHGMTLAQLTTLQTDMALWRGTLMLADAGAITLSHWDKMSFGTWISCYEGEIGFAWLSHPDKKAIDAHLSNPNNPGGTWLYKVIRPGESLYMPPGTIHTVFRRPQGTQTLGMAGHILRRSTDLDSWLEVLHRELQNALKQRRGYRFDEDHEVYIVPALMNTVRRFLDLAKKEGTVDRFGGQAKVDRAERLMEAVENDILEMRKAVAAATAPVPLGRGARAKVPKTTAAKPAPSKTTTVKKKASTGTGTGADAPAPKKKATKAAATKTKKAAAKSGKSKKTGK